VREVERPTGSGGVSGLPFAVLEVTDTGDGMSDEVRSRIFEPFFSTQPFGTNRGIDLASVHGMVVQSQGFIECDSSPGVGTTFRMFFPLSLQPERAATPPTGVRVIETRSVLMVDDDPLLRELGRRMLERLGHTVTTAASGEEALALLDTSVGNVTVVVTDLTMPEMGGLELIAHIEQRYPSLPVVAISGFTMNPTVREELDARHIPFVGKPFTSEELAKSIERANAYKLTI
jgi:two-component system cell cycle sensor histidine kinase/response regulator CckA